VKYVSLATEDALSEAVGDRLLGEHPGRLQAYQKLRRNGAGYLRQRLPSWCAMAVHNPVLLLTDLDAEACPATLVAQWIGRHEVPGSLLFRVAVREVESWLLADHEGMLSLLGKKCRMPPDPDALLNPKEYLINLARNAKRDVREDLVAAPRAVARQGLGYNSRLCAFVARGWSPRRAAGRSESLRRARRRIQELASEP
jgi:hypothetical protein